MIRQELIEHHLMDAGEACRFFGGNRPINRATLWRGAKEGRYPKPVKVGPNTARWIRSECVAALMALGGRKLDVSGSEAAPPVEATARPPAVIEEIPAPTAPIDDLQTALPSNRMQANIVGIYFLFFNDLLVYVGGSSNVLFRIGQHIRGGEIPFTTFSVLPCALRKISEVEDRYIKEWRPKYNVAQSSGFRATVNVNVQELKRW